MRITKNDLSKLSPSLSPKAREDSVREKFGICVNDEINRIFSSQGMKIEQVRAINAFFGNYIPDVDGICANCFKLSLPRRGPGIRWFSLSLSQCEIRLSEPKLHGQIGQRKIYITHQYALSKKLHIKWDGTVNLPTLDPKSAQEYTHLCWKTYDYEYITNCLSKQVPICQCPK